MKRTGMAGRWSRHRLALRLAAASSVGLVAWLGWQGTHAELSASHDLHGTDYAGSRACARCHDDHFASWHRTYHRTMTQEAGPDSVLGDFDGARSIYYGVSAEMRRDAQGRYWMHFSRDGGAERWQAQVVRTVGSHRYQQYLARIDDVLYRLPMAWHVAEGRWFHMNGAFLTPDPAAPAPGSAVSRDDYERHVTRWNDNCIFCHNVAPRPGLEPELERFRSEVAELGIACEACHGPGAEHVKRNSNPLRRYVLHASSRPDPTIINPDRLTPTRSSEVCGRCHGQRKTQDLDRFLVEGDPFVPGDALSDYSSPLWRHTTLDGVPDVFAARFWNDGTPRLTAYEFQGLLLSPCAQRGQLGCESCHAMHQGDPRGQLDPTRVGHAMCTDCHRTLAAPDQRLAHARHATATVADDCVSCHMPRIVYGLIDVHLSHRIESPDPQASFDTARPDACTLCHLDQSRVWAHEQMSRWRGRGDGMAYVHETENADLPEAVRMLIAGDPIERAVAAAAIGHANAAPRGSEAMAREVGWLLWTVEHDDYPAVRRIAWRSLQAHMRAAGAATEPVSGRLHRFDPTWTPSQRAGWVTELKSRLEPEFLLDPDPVRARDLQTRARALAIDIGE